ncbi:MAG TPA: hypothetical protein VJS66_01685 [Burkholderiales bacterium]|nr:hypothetical protein [Burkholderiales bacterium]
MTTWRLQGRVVAVGLPGVNGVRQVGRFHAGGPIPSNPRFLLQTYAGNVLDPERVLVAVSGNFGAALGNPDHAAGAVLSIDPRQRRTLVVPPRFAQSGGQAETLNGSVRLYTAQSPNFTNSLYNAGAHTASYTAAAGPRYLSMNNAFGRPWIANAPLGANAGGSVTVVDPDGAPLDNAPSVEAGGVFAGRLTDRQRTPLAQPSGLIAKIFNYRSSKQLTAGALTHAALGTAFLGPSPDGSSFAVFAAATADGAVAQVHVQDGVDGLAPPGTVKVQGDPGVIGMAFKWNPQRVLYLADAARDRIVLLHLDDDRRHFKVKHTSYIRAAALRAPIDIAAAVPEIANPRFSSHTTLAGGSDLYVANRGDGSLVRISQDGAVRARAQIDVPGLGIVGPERIRAIAVSADAQRLWLTVNGELPGFAGHEGALIEVRAFDASGSFDTAPAQTTAAPDVGLARRGARIFQQAFTPKTGLGPLFNADSCVACHPGPGSHSTRDEHFARRVAHMDTDTGRVKTIDHPNSPVARRYSTQTSKRPNASAPALPRRANIISLRMPPTLYTSARLDDVPDAVIEAQAVSKGDGIKGRVNYVGSANGQQRVGRYGWKADVATLEEMVAEAFANELGITSALAIQPKPIVEDDGSLVRAVVAYLKTLHTPQP